jgi:uncharacterized membrane protein YdjX (TVP38/TMEM64 family)
MVGIVALAIVFRKDLTPKALLSLSPKNVAAAVGFLVGLYVLKSLSIVLPVMALYILGGLLFPVCGAIAANCIGVAAGLSVCYVMGRWGGAGMVQELQKRFKKAAQVDVFLQKNTWFCAFFLRVVGFLPMDVVSLYLAASQVSFVPYLLGGLAGMLPGIIMGTLMGDNLSDPTSPAFWGSIACSVLLSGGSALWYRHYLRAHPTQPKQ